MIVIKMKEEDFGINPSLVRRDLGLLEEKINKDKNMNAEIT